MERKYLEEAGAHYRIPVFADKLMDLSGKEVTLSGFFLLYSRLDSVIIISRYPNASCFYCGMAGIESVAMIELETRAHFIEQIKNFSLRVNFTVTIPM